MFMNTAEHRLPSSDSCRLSTDFTQWHLVFIKAFILLKIYSCRFISQNFKQNMQELRHRQHLVRFSGVYYLLYFFSFLHFKVRPFYIQCVISSNKMDNPVCIVMYSFGVFSKPVFFFSSFPFSPLFLLQSAQQGKLSSVPVCLISVSYS